MKPFHRVLSDLDKAIEPSYPRLKVPVNSEDLQSLLHEFRRLDAITRVNHNKQIIENNQSLYNCYQCPNFHSFDLQGKKIGTCVALGITHEIPEDRCTKSIFDDLWCTFNGVEHSEKIQTCNNSKKPELIKHTLKSYGFHIDP